MIKGRLVIAALVAMCGTVAIVAATAGGQSAGADQQYTEPFPGYEPGKPLSPQPAATLDHSHQSCDVKPDQFWVGESFAGLELVKQGLRVCSSPEPETSIQAGGKVDPDTLTRTNFIAAIYGRCESKSDMGCAPPLQIQTWPACERSPADLTFGGPAEERTIEPTELTEVRGVPARFYGGRLELSIGDVTVVMFGESERLLLEAAAALKTTAESDEKIAAADELPEPVAGAETGKLPC